MAIWAVGASGQTPVARYVHGSWVNVRAQPLATAPLLEQVPANTRVEQWAQAGDWCEVRLPSGARGHVACRLLGDAPLTLADAAKDPARAFWVAPSPLRFQAMGQALDRPPALRLEALKKTHQLNQTVRFPPRAEFDAAKKRMRAGVQPLPAQELQRDAPVQPEKVMREFAALHLQPIRASAFATHADVALTHEAHEAALAAVARIKIAVIPTAEPVARFNRHSGPEIEYVTGFWDIGDAQLQFSPPLTVYSITAQGLVGAQQVRKVPWDISNEDFYCGARYANASTPWESGELAAVKGYARIPEGAQPLVSLVTAQALPARAVKVRAKRYPKSWVTDSGSFPPVKRTVRTAVVAYEIDVDSDGVADVLRVEVPHPGDMSGEPVFDAYWFVNIGGQWFAAGQMSDMECT